MGGQPPFPEVGPWARDKLDRLGKYLSAYTTIMKDQEWAQGYIYLDAFAGGGRALVRQAPAENAEADLGGDFSRDEDARQVLDGSPRVALGIEHPFTHYVFLERDPTRLAMLHALEQEYKGERKIFVRHGDCNEYLLGNLIRHPKIDWRSWRAVVFLDPFGMQVPWATMDALAGTRAIEVFLNFPVGMAIQRLLKRSGKFTEKERARLDAYFGDPGWFDVVYEKSTDFFEPIRLIKTEGAGNRLVTWYRERLKSSSDTQKRPLIDT